MLVVVFLFSGYFSYLRRTGTEIRLALPVTDGTAPWDVSRTLAYCAASASFGRCLGYPVRSLEDRDPLMVPDHSDISITMNAENNKKRSRLSKVSPTP